MRTTRSGVAAEARWRTRRRGHGTTSDGLSIRSVRLSDNEGAALGIKDCAVEILGTVVLVVVIVDVGTNWLGLGIVKVLLVEGADTVGSLLWVVFRVVRRKWTQAHR